MRTLVIGAALLALMAPDAYAQQSGSPTAAAVSGQTEPGHYMIFFELDRATLTSSARQVIAQAAQDYQRTGTVQIALAGHADRSASEDYNLRLSERRVEAVRGELVRLGVPTGSIATTAMGETDPLVQTADGVREPRNRRV
jgi:OOP family OmpA-OmpF porin